METLMLTEQDATLDVMGFAKVFLPVDQDQGGGHSLCAEYIGPATDFASEPGAGQSSSVYTIRLVQ